MKLQVELEVKDNAKLREIIETGKAYSLIDCKVVSEIDGKKYPVTPDGFVAELINKYELRKQCKRKTLFVVKDKGTFSIKKPYSLEIKQYLEKRYGDELVKIINEEL